MVIWEAKHAISFCQQETCILLINYQHKGYSMWVWSPSQRINPWKNWGIFRQTEISLKENNSYSEENKLEQPKNMASQQMYGVFQQISSKKWQPQKHLQDIWLNDQNSPWNLRPLIFPFPETCGHSGMIPMNDCQSELWTIVSHHELYPYLINYN